MNSRFCLLSKRRPKLHKKSIDGINFATNMDDSISLFESSLTKPVETAQQSSNDNDGEQVVDDVTRKLNAVANVIDMISKRMKEIERQVNMDAFKNEEEFEEKSASKIDNIEAAADSLPAYLIAASDPILSSYSQILQKAKQVTTNLLKKFEEIENESGLINGTEIVRGSRTPPCLRRDSRKWKR